MCLWARYMFTYTELLHSFRAILKEVKDHSDGGRRSLVASEEQTEQEISKLLSVQVRLLEYESQEITFSDAISSCFFLGNPLFHQSINCFENRVPRLLHHNTISKILVNSVLCHKKWNALQIANTWMAFRYAVPGKLRGREITPFMNAMYRKRSSSVSGSPGFMLSMFFTIKLNVICRGGKKK